MAEGDKLEPDDLPPLDGQSVAQSNTNGLDLPSHGLDLTRTVEGVEEKLLRQALEQADGVKAEAARLLGLKASALYYKLEKYGIEG